MELPRISYSFPSHSSIQFSSSLTPHPLSLSLSFSRLLWFLQWPPLQTLVSQLPSTFSQPLLSCWLLLCWESNPSMIGSTFQSGISVEGEVVLGVLGILWASLWTSISGLTLPSWIGCLRLSEWVSLRLSAMLALTLLLSLESTLWGTPFSFYTLHINFHFPFKHLSHLSTLYGSLHSRVVCFQQSLAAFRSTQDKITIFF